MKASITVARKELRALFQSPIAIIFLSVFLVATLFVFFTQAKFFARNLADVRPLFQWLPLLEIFLVSAITMRSWAEERKAGTLEVLLTLPIRTLDLVFGKFLAGMVLVGLALAFTLPIPLMVQLHGPLDWGPVIGGYFAALMLAGAYMSIGLCVSARTDNQVVALMTTLVTGGLLYLIGSDQITTFFDTNNAELLRQFGTGSRFESVERGVLDLRDIVYYGSLTAFFLVLNGVFLEWERLDTGSTHGRARSAALLTTVGLVAGNALLANLWLHPVHEARLDLTAGKDYTISAVTKQVLSELDEPLRIRAFMSENTHPLLAPMVPQILDTLEEYRIYGDDQVTIEVVDPNADPDVEAMINDQYGIESIPFGVTDRHTQSVVNAYFHVVVAYGDKFQVLSFDDLIEVRADSAGMNVKLKNLEYDLTRAIKKVTQDYETVDSLIAKLPQKAELTVYSTPATLPPDFEPALEAFRKVGQEYASINPDKVAFQEVDPSSDPALMQQLADSYGIQPLAADLFGQQRFYLHVLIKVGDHVERMMPRGELKEPDIRKGLEASFRRSIPGQLKKVVLLTEVPKNLPDPRLPANLQPPPPQPDFKQLEAVLAQNYTVERADLTTGYVPDDVDVVVVGKAGPLSAKQQFAMDQFLMKGGAVLALAGRYRVKADRAGLQAVPEDPSLFDLLAKWGVTVEESMVLAQKNAPFPLPVQQRLPNGASLQRIELIPYPFFPDLRGSALNQDHATMAGVTTMTMPWSSPLGVPETLEGREVTWLVHSEPDSTVRADGRIEPEIGDNGPDWKSTGEPKQFTLAVAITGKFPSAFADQPNPNVTNAGEGADTSGRTLKASVADGRLVVLGSSELSSDLLAALSNSIQSEQHKGNNQLVQNTLDWAVEETDLLSIRTAGAFARTLVPMEDSDAATAEYATWLFVLAPIGGVILIPMFLRRSTKPIPLSTVKESA